ncbi:hypothetical protein MSPP1_003769 [Malassezia sp. CBS 17886]|nr:hypothetical protein MSPP1_003769 [Malassezia sp. CBS 17886]
MHDSASVHSGCAGRAAASPGRAAASPGRAGRGSAQPTDQLRSLGLFERLYAARQALGAHTSVVITATYTVPTDVDDARLLQCLRAVVARLLPRHAALGCYVQGVGTLHPQYVRLETIDLDDVVELASIERADALAPLLETLHDVPWGPGAVPQWKLVGVREALGHARPVCSTVHFAFVSNHIIGDGLSGVAFHKTMLQELGGAWETCSAARGAATPPHLRVPRDASLTEPIEHATPFPLSWAFVARQLLGAFAPAWLSRTPEAPWAGQPPQLPHERPLRARIRLVTLPADEVRSLVEACRRNGVTLTSLLMAALAAVLADAVPDASAFVSQTPYTLRRVTRAPAVDMVNQTSALVRFSPDELRSVRRGALCLVHGGTDRPARIWALARRFHAHLRAELARAPRDNAVGLLPYVRDPMAFFRGQAGRPRATTWELSNVGAFRAERGTCPLPPGWTLRNVTFTQGAQPFGAAFCVNAAGLSGGPLALSVTWQAYVVSDAVADRVVEGLRELPRLVGGHMAAAR